MIKAKTREYLDHIMQFIQVRNLIENKQFTLDAIVEFWRSQEYGMCNCSALNFKVGSMGHF